MTSAPGPCNPEYERKAILQRLGLDGTGRGWVVIHVARAPGQEAVEQLRREGRVKYQWGSDSLAGVMLVSAVVQPRAPSPWGGMRA